jgi:Protein of unknown function (DUF3800)
MSAARDVHQLSQAVLAGRKGVVLVFKAFLDEAGIHDGARVVSVAGYFARPKQWRDFTRDWNRVLRPSGIECFHATDCQALEGEFRGWTAEKRDELVKKLLPIIPKYATGFARVIVLDDLRPALDARPHLRKFLESPYKACFQWIIQEAIRNIRRNNSPEKIAFFHERNDHRKAAIESFDWLKKHHDPNNNLVSLTFGDPITYPPLQAADILAFESGKRVLNKTGLKRRSYEVLCGGNSVQIGLVDKDNMDKAIAMLEFLNSPSNDESEPVS